MNVIVAPGAKEHPHKEVLTWELALGTSEPLLAIDPAMARPSVATLSKADLLVLYHFGLGSLRWALVARLLGVRVILVPDVHDDAIAVLQRRPQTFSLISRPRSFRLIARALVSLVDTVALEGSRRATALRPFVREKGRPFVRAVSPDLIAGAQSAQVRTESGQVRIVVCGRHDAYQKGADLLTRAMELIQSERWVQSLEFRLVGSGSTHIARQLRALGITAVPTETASLFHVGEIMGGSDAALFPARFEGAPVAAVEAARVGCLVAGTRVGIIPDLIAQQGILQPVEPDRAELLAHQVWELFDAVCTARRAGSVLAVPQSVDVAREMMWVHED